MANLTKIRALQIQESSPTEGITNLQLKANAGVRTEQLAEGASFIKKDGSVAFTGNTVSIPGVNSDHIITKGQLDTAIANAGTANSTLATALADEISARTIADTTLGGRIDTVETSIAGEITARGTADTTLQNNITAEATARQNADNSLQTQIDTEQAARISAVAAANTAITQEAQDRAAADTALQGTVSTLLTSKADLAGNATQVFAVASPTQASHAANKAYVDGVAQGLDVKGSVRVATTAPLANLAGLQVVDSVQLGVGDRVLVKNQADAKENGLYIATGGSWTRADDADNSPLAEFTAGLFVFVEEGDTNSQAGFVCSSPNTPLYEVNGIAAIELDAVPVEFVQFSGAGQILAGTGIDKSGNTLSLSDTGVAVGTYTKVTVDAQGRITVGANPTTLLGYGITDAANISGSQTQVFQVKDAAATFDAINKGQLDAAITAVTLNINNGGDALAAEITARENADSTLQSNIAAEATARALAVTAEATTRAANDVTLQDNITAEQNARTGADTTLQNNIDGVTTALNNEISARGTADTTLQSNIDAANTAINAEATTRGLDDVALQAAIDAEALTRGNADATLTTNLAAEVTARIAGDAGLQGSVDTLTTNLATEVTNRTTAVTNEATARDAADVLLQAAIDAEETARIAADDALGVLITNASGNLGTNYYTKAQVDTTFQNLVNAAPAALDTLGEIAAQLAADESAAAALTTAIANEVTRATAAEVALGTALDTEEAALVAEIARATGAESTLTTAISTEATTARAAESTLTTNLAAEVTRATAAEGVLTTDLASEVTNRTNAIAALTGSNGVERTANDFHVKLATASGLVADVNGLKIDMSVMTAARLKVRDPFSGVQDGTNVEYTLSATPIAGTEQIFVNGLLQYPGAGNDYLIVGTVVTFTTPPTAVDRISINFTAE
jgi:hypothetical protein